MSKESKWLDQYPLVGGEHAPELEARAAALEFKDRLPRDEAEAQAHHDYLGRHALEAAAHHLTHARAAREMGDDEAAGKHGDGYATALKHLGLDPVGPVPKEVLEHVRNTPSKYRFRPHAADGILAGDPGSDSTRQKLEKILKLKRAPDGDSNT